MATKKLILMSVLLLFSLPYSLAGVSVDIDGKIYHCLQDGQPQGEWKCVKRCVRRRSSDGVCNKYTTDYCGYGNCQPVCVRRRSSDGVCNKYVADMCSD